MVDTRHPDHAWQEHTFGCAHTSCGRVLPQYRTAAAFDDPSGWKNSAAVAPSPIATQGASAYHSLSGIPEPAPVDFSRPFRTPSSVSTVGRHYDALPTYQPEAVPHYAAMADEVNKQYDHMTNKLGINVQSMDHDPYPDVGSMMADVNNNHRLQVMGTHITGSHPFFDDATNDKFRAVHDFYGHAGTGRGFDRHGEEAAFIKHAGMFTPAARPALASETRGQNSSLILNGGFPGQKVATMDPRMMTAKGDPSYLRPGKCKYCKDPATKSILHSEGMAYVQTCDKHHAKGMKDAEACVPFGPPDPGNIDKIYDLGTKKVVAATVDALPFHFSAHPKDVLQYANPGNPELHSENMPELRKSVLRNGVQKPVSMFTNGTHAVLDDGHHRTAAADQVGVSSVPINMDYEPDLFRDFPDARLLQPGAIKDWIDTHEYGGTPESTGRPIWNKTAMPTYYHITDNPDFRLDPNHVPEDLEAEPEELGGNNRAPMGAGVFLTQDRDQWRHSYPGRENRGYDAEFHAPDLRGMAIDHDGIGDPEQYFVPADKYHLLTPNGVHPTKQSSWYTEDDLKTAMSWYTGGADTWPGKTTRERRDMWHNMGKWALEDADEHGLGHTPGDEYSKVASAQLHIPMDEMNNYAVWGVPDHDSPFEGLGEHIRANGVQEPLTVATDGQRAYLQDGYHRWEEAKNAGHPQLPVNIEHVHPRAIDDQGNGGVDIGPALAAHLNQRTSAYYTEDDMRYGPPPGTRPIVRHPDGSTQELAEWARQGAAADWTHDPDTDTYTHPSGHVLKPSDEMEGAHQLWTPTVGFPGRYPESLAKERGPSPDLQRHFDRVDFVTADPSPRKRMRRSMSRQIITAREQVQMLEPWLLEAAYGMEYDPADVPDHPRANQVYPELPMEHEPPEAPDERYIPEHLMKRRRSSFPQAAQGGLPRNAGVGDEVFEHLKHSPGGITFKHHPGDRGDVYEDDMGSRGYMVSTPDAEKKQDYATMTPKDVDDYYHGHPEIQEPGNSYGGWEEDREPPEPPGSDWYHDVPKNIHDTYDATGKALDWKQKAIFDNDKVDPKGNALDSAYLYTPDLANSGPASALGWTQAKRRMPT